MKKRSLFQALAAIFVAWIAALGGVGSANAGSTTQTFETAGYPTDLPVPYTFNFAANQFNMPSCTLTSVVISVQTNILGVVSVVNFNSTPENFTNATTSVPVQLTGPTGPDSLTINGLATTPPQSGTVGPATVFIIPVIGPVTVPGMTTLPGMAASTTDTKSISGSGVSPYVGNGISNLNFSYTAGTGMFSGNANSGVFFGGSADASAKITITYTWTTTAVPEPASMSLLGIGMAGFFAFRRFFNKRNADV